MLGVGAIVMTPVVAKDAPARAEQAAVALAAQTQPLPPPTPFASHPLDLLGHK